MENEDSDSCPDDNPFVVLNRIHGSCIASLVIISLHTDIGRI